MKDTRAVQQIAQDQREHIIDSGIVRSMRGQYVDVLLDGTKKLVREVILSKSITTINVGWWVVIARIPRTNRWVALVTLESISTGSSAVSSDLTAPANVTATAKPYVIELSWSGSFRDVATYEVQHNSSASETGATSLKIEGSNFLYWCAPGTQRYFRVRAVSSAFERSAWSSWVNATSTTGAAYMFLGVDAAGTSPIWTAFNWTNVSGVAGAAMSHDHSTAAKGGTSLLSLTELSFNAATELTISGGSVTRTQVFHTIDTQNDDATDDLDTIAGGADGKLIIIRPADDARTVVVKHNTGNIWLSGAADITLDDAGDALILLYVNALSKWVDIGWSAGGGGGGAPTGAQYLVLALDASLTAERRFVDGDGLQAVDGGANGDYTLNIDVSDFAGTGLEDDGAENLRIAAAAAGDGLQGGGGDPLAIDASEIAGTGLEDDGAENLRIAAAAAGDGLTGGGGDALAVNATVVRTSGDQTVAGVKTFSDNVLVASGKDVFPDADTAGVAQRLIYFGINPSDHFRGSFGYLTTGWAAAPFAGTPDTVDFAGYPDFVVLGDDTTSDRFFRYRTTNHSLGNTATMRGRLAGVSDSRVGIRIDTGSDADFAELYVEAGATGLCDIVSRYRYNSGTITTTVEINDIPTMRFLLRISAMGTNLIRCYYAIDTCMEALLATTLGDMDDWSTAPTRVGIIYERTTGTNTPIRRGYYDWFESNFSVP